MKKFLIIITSLFFGLLVLINSAMFKFVLSGPALIVSSIISWIVVAILSFIISAHYMRFNKINSDSKKAWEIILKVFGR